MSAMLEPTDPADKAATAAAGFALLREAAATWPAPLRLAAFPPDQAPAVPSGHPLAEEIRALLEGRSAAIPVFDAKHAAWYSAARDVASLRQAVDVLRAWVIPSIGWEEPDGAYVTAADPATGDWPARFAAAGLPAIYRWRSQPGGVAAAAEALKQARRLEMQRPTRERPAAPTLFDLRRRYVLALVSGDERQAEGAVNAIESAALDTPANVSFMRYRLWDHFGEPQRIVDDLSLDRLLRQQIPRRVRLAVACAFHSVYLAGEEARDDNTAARESYSENVHPRLGPTIALLRPEDGPEAARLLAYRASRRGERPAQLSALIVADPWIGKLLGGSEPAIAEPAVTTTPIPREVPPAVVEEPPEVRFWTAVGRGDWRTAQELAEPLLAGSQADVARQLLRRSLEFVPNPQLRTQLEALETPSSAAPKTVQSWAEWVDVVRTGDLAAAEAFVRSDRPDIGRCSGDDCGALAAGMDEMFTDSAWRSDTARRRRVEAGLAELVADVVHEPKFPRRAWSDLYQSLFRLWSDLYAGSADPLDGSVLLTLGLGALTSPGGAEAEVADAVKTWWQRRRIRALLPFLLDAIETLVSHSQQDAVCQELWIDAGSVVRADGDAVPASDRLLWRSLGERLGFEREVIDQTVPAPPPASTTADPLSATGLRKIALVWRLESAAKLAAQRLEQRTGVEVVLVTEEHPRSQAAAAKTADVLLLVWRNISHAVFRAFDGIPRSRLAYVNGEGATSIERALERWLIEDSKSE
jgi:hypothetical protein